MNRIYFIIMSFFLLLAMPLFGVEEQELLKESDINQIMQQIFEQHVDKKQISQEILKHSFLIYFEQFDGDKLYLKNEEMRPFVDLSNSQMAFYIQDYQKGDFSPYEQLNKVIQKTITRAREWRKELEKNKETFFSKAKMAVRKGENLSEKAEPLSFAKNDQELKERIEQQFVRFISNEIQQFGEWAVMNNQPQVIALYETQMKNYENHYLFQGAEGNPLPVAERENLMAMHILKALASSLDAHTSFFDASEAYDMRIHLEKELHGIGIVFHQGLDSIIVSQLVHGGPAEKSKLIKVNDEIIEVDGKAVAGHPFQTVMEWIRGEDGSTVKLKIRRHAEAQMGQTGQLSAEVKMVTLKRQEIAMDNDRVDMSYESFGDGIIGKLVLHSFYQGDNGISSEEDLRDAIQQLKKQGNLRGLILDLRENSGGFLNQAIKVVGLFISNGIVVTSKYSNGEEQIYRDIDGKRAYDGPLVVLISKMTASAAEIVAQALQDYGVALIVGDPHSYGKGSIQSQTVTDNHSTSFFKVTIGKYYTVSGKTPQIRGVQADIVVKGPFSQEHIGEQYLQYTLNNDTIKAAFDDTLQDIPVKYKPWLLKYYVPTIQHPTDEWKKLVPAIAKNSEVRIAHNKKYQEFLEKLKVASAQKSTYFASGNEDRQAIEELQMHEAVNIIKDMVILHSRWTTQPSVGSQMPPILPLQATK